MSYISIVIEKKEKDKASAHLGVHFQILGKSGWRYGNLQYKAGEVDPSPDNCTRTGEGVYAINLARRSARDWSGA
jgi:hypothetical protein